MTLDGASITSESSMAIQSEDIIALVKKAETEAAESVKRAEEEKRQAVAQAEQEATKALATARERCTRDQEAAMEKAKAEAAELQSQARAEAEAAARDIQVVPQERLEKAADLLVENLRRQWQ